MEGRRWSRRLHQAIEAKEGVQDPRGEPDARHDHLPELLPPLREARRHDRHRRHRGEGVQEDLQPRRRRDPHERPDDPRRRRTTDLQDQAKAKWNAVLEEIEERHEPGQPVLVGTISIEKSEMLSGAQARGIPHRCSTPSPSTSARRDHRPGRPGAVTIATNMAGRGVDIKLGGNPSTRRAARNVRAREQVGAGERVKELGGLFILGTERHESRRIDNQLRGRSGRQGDPGESRFYLSARGRPRAPLRRRPHLRDHGEARPVDEHGEPDRGVASSPSRSRTRRRRSRNRTSIRKRVLEYDDVMNQQRMVIYEYRDADPRGRRTCPRRCASCSRRSSRNVGASITGFRHPRGVGSRGARHACGSLRRHHPSRSSAEEVDLAREDR
jgi:preprotein translocase subunit SecA